MSAIWSGNSALADLGGAGPLSASLDVGKLPRVRAEVMPPSGPFEVQVDFERHDAALLLDATIRGRISVGCQRCLEPMPIALDSRMQVALVADEAATATAPEGYDVVVAPDGQIRLLDLVEDEILLAIPFSSRHNAGECGPLAKQLERLQADAETTTPFAGLGELLRDKGN